jgi:hypothetical protein
VGSRQRAVELTDHLPKSLQHSTVVIDASGLASAAQSFADELCKQILEVREAEELVVHCATPRFAAHLNTSAQLRRCSERLSVDVRP